MSHFTIADARHYALTYVREPSWTLPVLRASVARAELHLRQCGAPTVRAAIAYRWQAAFLRRALNMRRRMVGARTLP